MSKNVLSSLIILFVIVFQMLPIRSIATNIDESTARQYGAYYLSVMTGKETANDSQISLAYTFMNEELNIPAAYVFNIDKQGFVIVSGSDLWYPILGYSAEGMVDSSRMSLAFKEYISAMCNNISYSQNTGIKLINDVEKEWTDLKYQKLSKKSNNKSTEYLMNSEWGQGEPSNPTYNKFCPYIDKNGERFTALVGCGATATSQIIHYWKYPQEPVNDYIGLSCFVDDIYFGYIDIDMSEVTYDFSKMPRKIESTTTDEEIDAIATLCYHVGVSIKMKYGIEVSISYVTDALKALRDVFLYDSTIECVTRLQGGNSYGNPLYTNEEWIDVLATEIDAGRPILYCGQSLTYGGHIYVCDGHHATNSNLFHFNWGWDGFENGWFDVRDAESGGANFEFHLNPWILTHIQPRIASEPDVPEGISNLFVNLSPAYPNPATTKISIPYYLNSESGADMMIYSIEGRLMECFPLNYGSHIIQLDISNYPQGVYVYRVGGISHKFIVK